MSRACWIGSVLVTLMVVTVVSSLQAVEPIVRVLPDTTYGFVVIHDAEQASSKIARIATLLDQPDPRALEELLDHLGIAEGFDRRGPLALAALPSGNGASEPVPCLILPVSNYEQLIGNLGGEDRSGKITAITLGGRGCLAARKDRYVVVVTSEHRATLQALLESTNPVVGKIEPLRPFLATERDAHGVVTQSGIRLLAEQALAGLQVIKQQIEATGGEQAEMAVASVGMYEPMLEFARDHVTDFAIGLKVDEDGTAHLASRTLFDTGTPAIPRGGENLLAGLPSGPFVFAFASTLNEQWSRAMMEFSMSFVKQMAQAADIQPEQLERMVQLSIDSMKGVRAIGMVMGAGKVGEALYDNTTMVLRVEDSQAYLDRYAEFVRAMRRLAQQSNMAFYQFDEPQTVQINGTSALKVTMDTTSMFPFHDEEQARQMQQMLRWMFGPEGKLTFYYTAADPSTVVGAYTSTETLKKVLATTRKPDSDLAHDPRVAKTSQLLLQQPDMVGYFSPSGVVAMVNQMTSALAPDAPQNIPPMEDTAPVGLAAAAIEGGIDTDLVVPAELIRTVGKYLSNLWPARAAEEQPDSGLRE